MVAIFFAKQVTRAGFFRFFARQYNFIDRQINPDFFINNLLHFLLLFVGHFAVKGKVKAQTLPGNITALLGHRWPQDVRQGLLEQVGSGVVFNDLFTIPA